MQSDRPFWQTEAAQPLPALTADVDAEIVVVGAGIAGLSSAYLLTRCGYNVHVIDKTGVAEGMTGRSTSHLAVALDDGWRNLVKTLGQTKTRLVSRAYRAGLELIARTQAEEAFACDYAQIDGYLVGTRSDVGVLAAEKVAASQAGLTGIEWAPAPFPRAIDAVALRFPGQARIDPVKYVCGLARAITRNGGTFHAGEITHVAEDGGQVTLTAKGGQRIRARNAAILATKTGLGFAPIGQVQRTVRSYVIAAELPKGSVVDAVSWDLEDPYHYVRLAPGETSDVLIVGGEDQDIGTAAEPDHRFARLETWTRARFPMLGKVRARWIGSLKETRDNLGLLGRSAPGSRVYIVDGDGGLGFTHAAVGAMIIRDLMEGRENPAAPLFDPLRFGAARHPLIAESAVMSAAV
jgi:glycine/D-amino acid oxidase-like deaminating enzyme